MAESSGCSVQKLFSEVMGVDSARRWWAECASCMRGRYYLGVPKRGVQGEGGRREMVRRRMADKQILDILQRYESARSLTLCYAVNRSHSPFP